MMLRSVSALITVGVLVGTANAQARSATAVRASVALGVSQCPQPAANGARRIPARFEEGHIIAAPLSLTGDTTFFLLDSGGGANFIFTDAVVALGLKPEKSTGPTPMSMQVVSFPPFRDSTPLPAPLAGPVSGGKLLVMAAKDNPIQPLVATHVSGFLGGGWFADRTWGIDYLNHTLWLYPHSVLHTSPATAANAHVIPLGFHTEKGHRTTNFPRIRISVGGDSVNLLFDTGASTRLSDSALAVIGDGRPSKRSASFITSAVFDRWHSQHPEWRVIEHAEVGTGAAMIEVPEVEVAGYTVGPVWFTWRKSEALHGMMDPLMDQPVEGAFGGSGLQYFSVTIDYPNSLACFAK